MKWHASILTRKKASKKSLGAFDALSKVSQAEIQTLTTAFKAFSSQCVKANISTQPLARLLSTIYGQLMVEKGYLAMLSDRISTTPILLNREMLIEYCQWLSEEIELLDWILMTSEDGLRAAQTAPVLSSGSGGD